MSADDIGAFGEIALLVAAGCFMLYLGARQPAPSLHELQRAGANRRTMRWGAVAAFGLALLLGGRWYAEVYIVDWQPVTVESYRFEIEFPGAPERSTSETAGHRPVARFHSTKLRRVFSSR